MRRLHPVAWVSRQAEVVLHAALAPVNHTDAVSVAAVFILCAVPSVSKRAEFVVDTALIQICDPEVCGCGDCYIQEGKKLVLTTMTDIYLPEGDDFMVVSIVQNNIAQNSFFRVYYSYCWPPDDPDCEVHDNFHTYSNGKVMAQYVRNTQGLWSGY